MANQINLKDIILEICRVVGILGVQQVSVMSNRGRYSVHSRTLTAVRALAASAWARGTFFRLFRAATCELPAGARRLRSMLSSGFGCSYKQIYEYTVYAYIPNPTNSQLYNTPALSDSDPPPTSTIECSPLIHLLGVDVIPPQQPRGTTPFPSTQWVDLHAEDRIRAQSDGSMHPEASHRTQRHGDQAQNWRMDIYSGG
jgi:hypothetical protein